MSCNQNNDNSSHERSEDFVLRVEGTSKKCASGERVAQENLDANKIPVISCEGACIRGEIARQTANLISKQEPYRRGCHGELFAVPNSTMTKWIKKADKLVLIDGCFLHCHKRMIQNIIDESQIIHFDALSYYKNYNDLFDIDSVPESERKVVIQEVSAAILQQLQTGSIDKIDQVSSCCN